MFIYWKVLPYRYPVTRIPFGGLLLIALVGRSVYIRFLLGFSSKRKYSYMGAIRGVAQSLSFEVVFFFLVFSFISVYKSLTVCAYSRVFYLPLSVLWLLFILAEIGRAPFDFTEAERELVSGFNLEYGAVFFVFIFLSEYGFLLFFSILFSLVFLEWMGFPCFSFYIAVTLRLVLRAVLPRYRYDSLMGLFWEILLPVSILQMLLYYIMIC